MMIQADWNIVIGCSATFLAVAVVMLVKRLWCRSGKDMAALSVLPPDKVKKPEPKVTDNFGVPPRRAPTMEEAIAAANAQGRPGEKPKVVALKSVPVVRPGKKTIPVSLSSGNTGTAISFAPNDSDGSADGGKEPETPPDKGNK